MSFGVCILYSSLHIKLPFFIKIIKQSNRSALKRVQIYWNTHNTAAYIHIYHTSLPKIHDTHSYAKRIKIMRNILYIITKLRWCATWESPALYPFIAYEFCILYSSLFMFAVSSLPFSLPRYMRSLFFPCLVHFWVCKWLYEMLSTTKRWWWW